MKQPLEDIHVIDLTRLGPGPFCTMILSDWGASVLKVEQPGGGLRASAERAARGSINDQIRRRQQAHDALGRNKRSIALDLKTQEGLKLFNTLAEQADIVVEGFRPGVVDRLGIGYEAITKVNPAIIYCSISGYGQTGPYRGLVGHDINFVAIAGALSLVGEMDGRPRMPSNILADFAAGGQQAVIGILLALLARGRNGKGQYIDLSMTDGVLSLLADETSRFYAGDKIPMRGKTRYTGALPYYDVYETKDEKYIAVGCNDPHFYANLCKALGLEEFLPHQYTEGKKRVEITEAFARAFQTKTRDVWFNTLKEHDICVAPVNDLAEALNDPQLLARDMIVEFDDPVLGKVKQVGIPIKLSATPGKVRSAAPQRGQHTKEVLRELGYSDAEIRKMIEKKIAEQAQDPK